MPVNNRIYPIRNARIHDGPDLADFSDGITLVISGQDGNANDRAFPVLGEMVDGAGIVKLRPLRTPAIHGHAMQRDGTAVFINNFGSLNTKLAVNPDKCRLPETH